MISFVHCETFQCLCSVFCSVQESGIILNTINVVVLARGSMVIID